MCASSGSGARQQSDDSSGSSPRPPTSQGSEAAPAAIPAIPVVLDSLHNTGGLKKHIPLTCQVSLPPACCSTSIASPLFCWHSNSCTGKLSNYDADDIGDDLICRHHQPNWNCIVLCKHAILVAGQRAASKAQSFVPHGRSVWCVMGVLQGLAPALELTACPENQGANPCPQSLP